MELIKNTVYLCEVTAKGTAQAMSDGDVIVPDIKPDILKLLQVDADACITDKYIENGRIILCGRVDYKVLYVPDREHELIKGIDASMDFRQAADGAGAGNDSKIITSVNVERVEFNAVNSRKLRLRAIIRIDYEVCNINETEICCDIEGDSIECEKADVKIENTVDISEHDFSLKEVLEVPSGQNAIKEVLKTDVTISDTEYKTVTGKVIVKGNAGICILYTDDENEIKYIEAEVPFTEVFDADGVGENTICDIDYGVTGIMCEIQPDSDGDMRVAEVDVDITSCLKGTETLETEIVKDCFVPYMETKCQTNKVSVTETAERTSTVNTIREIIVFPNNIPEVRGIYNVMTNVNVHKAELQRNRIICEGKIEAYILYLTDSTENPVYSFKKEIPFSYMLECENALPNSEAEIKAVIRHISYNLNSGGNLELRCVLSIDGKLTMTDELDNIVEISAEEKKTSRGIVIYFTHDGDSLWNVARKYAVPPERICECNSIENGQIKPGITLFIPSR